MSFEGHQTRDPIEDIWGPRTPYKHEWPVRVDERYTEKPEKWVQSACVLCSNGCGMDIGVKDSKIVGVRGRAVDRVNKGRLGPKGLYGSFSNDHKDRLKYPMVRKNGQLQRASWDEAMSLIVEKTKDVQKRLTNHGVAFYTSGQLFLEEYYVLAMVGKAGLNTLHMDGNTRLCTASAAASMRESFGSDGQPGSYTDIDYTDCLFIVGHNISATQTVLWSRMLDRLEGPDPPKVIVIDPRLSNTAKKATVHLAPRIGTNMAVLNGIQHLLFENGWVNDEYVAKHVIGVEELRKKVKPYNPTYVEEVTGIPESQLRNAAEIIGNTPSMLSTALQGVYQSNQATASACQINNINLLRGLIGRPGSGIYQMNGQPTAQNNREAGCDGEYPGFRNFQNPQQMQEIADIWNIDFHKIPHWNEPTHIESMLNYIDGGTIELFWISGTNPLVSLPNLPRVREILTKKELFVVCQDIFPTETTAIADVVLPAAQWGEKTGCFTNVDRTVHLSNKAIDPPGEAKSDLDIFLDYSKRMDFRDKYGSPLTPWTESSQVFEAWKKMSKGRPCDYSEMTYKKLTGGSGIQWPCTEKYPHGRERLFEDGVFFTDVDYCESFGHDLETGAPLTLDQYRAMNPAGRAILKSADYLPALDAPDKEYPLQLSTGRRVYHFHTRTKTGRSKELQAAAPGPMIEVSAEDAVAANVEDGEDVVVRSRRGIVEMPIRISKIAKGQTFIPFHYGYFDAPDSRARAANELTQEQWDPISKQPMFKSGAIRIEKLTPSPSGTVKIHAREKQTTAIDKVTRAKPQAHDISDPSAHSRERHLEFWLGATYEAINVLIEICSRLIPQYIHQDEVHAGVKVMRRITGSMAEKLKPLAFKYGEKNEYGLGVSTTLRDNLFPDYLHERAPSTYEVLVGLQALYMYNAHVQSHLIALTPASQALRDSDFVEAVSFCTTQIERQQAWVKQQIKVRGPQTLLVPTTPLPKGFVLRERTGSAQDPIHAFRDREVTAEDLPFGKEPK